MKKPSIRDQALSLSMRFKTEGISQTEIAEALGVSQSQVSRILAGQVKRHSKLFEDLSIYAQKRFEGISPKLVCENQQLINAIADVWDGTTRHAQALACVIRSLGALGMPQAKESGERRNP